MSFATAPRAAGGWQSSWPVTPAGPMCVLALPRGGVPVGCEVARALRAPLDVFLVRKLGLPGHEELAMGAIASGGVRVLNHDVVDALDIPEDVIGAVAEPAGQPAPPRAAA